MINIKEVNRIKKFIEAYPTEINGIIEDTDMCIYITDSTGTIVEINSHYTRVFGLKRTEVVGKHFTVIYPAEYVGELKETYSLSFRKKISRLRKLQSVTQKKEKVMVYEDSFYSDKIKGQLHKVTFVQTAFF